jgi:ribose transport system substrate-binding protein
MHRRARTRLATVLVALAATVVAATVLAGPAAPAKKPHYGMIGTINHPYYFPAVKDSATACKELGCTREFHMPTQFNVQAQIPIIDDMISKGVDGIAISAADDKAMTPIVERIRREKGASFPIVTFNADCCEKVRTIGISNSDAEIGVLDGKAVNQLLPQGGRILNIIGGVELKNVRDRLRTLKATLRKNIAMDAVSDQNTLSNTPQVLRDALTKNPDYDLILTQTGSSAVVCETLKQDGKSIPVVGLNSFADVMAWVREGCIKSTIGLNPGLQGELAVRALDLLRTGHKLKRGAPTFFGTGGVIITQKNLRTWQKDVAALNARLRAQFLSFWTPAVKR